MKTKFIITVLFTVTVAVFLFTKPKANENNVTNVTSFMNIDTFRIGAYGDGYVRNKYDSLKELGLNLWHYFSGINAGWWWMGVGGDCRDSSYSLYGQNVKNRIDSNYQYGNAKTVMDRPKINYLCWGKRSDYECEEDYINSNYWFYAYREHDDDVSIDALDNSQYGSNNTYVRYSGVNYGHTPGYVVKGLKSNREQLNLLLGEKVKWYIMPRIRINVSDAYSNKYVCRIEILRYDSALIKSVDIYGADFIYNENYSGQYIDTLKSNLLTIDSTEAFNPGHVSHGDTACKVDFRVWWYGECDMWIDRIRVENEIAHRLLSYPPDQQFEEWLVWEAQDIAGAKVGKAHYFLYDEPEFSTLPCLAYINKKIIQLSGGTTSLVPNFNRENLRVHMPNFTNINFSVEQLKTYLIDSAGFQMYLFDCYPLYGSDWYERSKLPNTLPCGNVDYNATIGMLTRDTNTTSYENWLQLNFDYENIPNREIISYKRAKYISQNYTVPFYALVQTHLNNASDGILREPTNEENAMMTNVSLFFRSLLVF